MQEKNDTIFQSFRLHLQSAEEERWKIAAHVWELGSRLDSLVAIYLVGRSAMGEELRFLWNATRGNRLRPWRSPYLRWRLETYSGQKAETVQARDFWNLFWAEKRQLLRFLRWTREMKQYSNPAARP
jgi:hypothetical protein